MTVNTTDWLTESITVNSNPAKIVCIANCGTRMVANQRINKLMTKENNPKVIMVIGNARIFRIGFTKKLSSPKTPASIIGFITKSIPVVLNSMSFMK